jgi:hypothetical protein
MTAQEYRAKAEEARREAARSDDARVKAQWLKMAEGWDDLAVSAERRLGPGGDQPQRGPPWRGRPEKRNGPASPPGR